MYGMYLKIWDLPFPYETRTSSPTHLHRLRSIKWYAANFQQQWKCSWPRDKPRKRERERKQSWMKLFPKAGQLTKSPVERRMKYILIITDGPKSTHWDCLRNILLQWWMMMAEMFIFLSQFLTHKVVISIDWKEGKKAELQDLTPWQP